MRCASKGLQQWTPEVDRADPVELAVITEVTISGTDSVYTTSASSSLACCTILYASPPSLRKRKMYRLVGMERFMSSSNWPSAARQVFAADSPVQSERTNIGFGEHVIRGNHRRLLVLSLAGSLLDSLCRRCGGCTAAAARSGSCSATVFPSCAAVDVTGVFRMNWTPARAATCGAFSGGSGWSRARADGVSCASLGVFRRLDRRSSRGVDVATAIFLAPAPAPWSTDPAAPPASPSTLISFIAASTAFNFLGASRPPSPLVFLFSFIGQLPREFLELRYALAEVAFLRLRLRFGVGELLLRLLDAFSLARSTLSSMPKASSLTGAASPVTRSKTPVFAPVLTNA